MGGGNSFADVLEVDKLTPHSATSSAIFEKLPPDGRVHYPLWHVDYKKVKLPLVLCFIVLLIAFTHLGQHRIKHFVSKHAGNKTLKYFQWVCGVPETCLLMVLGIILGLVLPNPMIWGKDGMLHYLLDPHVFFLFILPPIVFEAGYEMPRAAFLSNFMDILVYAIIGTAMNTFIIGLSLYYIHEYVGFGELALDYHSLDPKEAAAYLSIGNYTGTNLTDSNVIASFLADDLKTTHDTTLCINVFLLFGAIISAVDPVAVIAVFNEIKVNVNLYILVLGESILNDGVAIVFFQVFCKFIEIGEKYGMDVIDGRVMFAGFLNFIIVAGGGTIIGISIGLLAAYLSKYTHTLSSMEPAVVFGFSYIAYLLAEMTETSSILAIVFCGFSMRFFIERNMNPKSISALHSMNKMMATIAEMTIFVMLGIAAAKANWAEHFYWKFSLVCLALCSVARPLVTFFLTYLLNKKRVDKLDWKDQFIMSFSGLRGGIAYSLIVLAIMEGAIPREEGVDPHELGKLEEAFMLTTIFIIFFTVFVQGSLVESVVKYLEIKIEKPEEREGYNLTCSVNEKLINHVTDGIIGILGSAGVSNFTTVNNFENFLNTYLNPILLREKLSEKSDLDATEIADIWSAELQDDLNSFVAHDSGLQKEDGKPKMTRVKSQNVTKQHLMAQLNSVIDDSTLPWKSVSALRHGQSGVADEVMKKAEFKHIQDRVYKRDCGVAHDYDLNSENFGKGWATLRRNRSAVGMSSVGSDNLSKTSGSLRDRMMAAAKKMKENEGQGDENKGLISNDNNSEPAAKTGSRSGWGSLKSKPSTSSSLYM